MLLEDEFGGSFGVCRLAFRRYACGVPGPVACPLRMQLSAFGPLPMFVRDRVSHTRIALSLPPVAKPTYRIQRIEMHHVEYAPSKMM